MSSRRARQWIVDAAAIFTLLLFAIPVWLILAQQDHLSSNGITTTGIVQNKTFARGGNDNSPDWFISYAFKDATGREHVGSSRVDATFFNRVSPGETLTIEYLADQPGTSRIARAANPGIGEALALGGVGVAFFYFLGPQRWLRQLSGGRDPVLD